MPEACVWLSPALLPLKRFHGERAVPLHFPSHLKGALCKNVFRTLIFITPQGKKERWVIYIKLKISCTAHFYPTPKKERGRTANVLEMSVAMWGLTQEGKCLWRQEVENQRIWPSPSVAQDRPECRWKQTTSLGTPRGRIKEAWFCVASLLCEISPASPWKLWQLKPVDYFQKTKIQLLWLKKAVFILAIY